MSSSATGNVTRPETATAPPAPWQPAPAEGLTLTELLHVIRRHQLVALVVGLGTAVLTAFLLLSSVTLYEAVAVLVIQYREEPIEGASRRQRTEGQYEEDLLNTTGELITSNGTLQAALADGPLMANPIYATSRDPVALLSSRLFATGNTGDSWTIQLKLKDEDPLRAEAGLRGILEAYQQRQKALDAKLADSELAILGKEVEEAARKLTANRLAEQNFRNEHGILSVNPDTDVRAQRLRDANANRVELTARIAALQGVIDQIALAESPADPKVRTSELLRISRINSHPLVKDQQNLVYDFRAAYQEASQRFLEKHPRMIEIAAKLAEKERQLDDAIDIAKQVVLSEYQELCGQRDSTNQSIEIWTAELAKMQDAASQLQILSERTQALKTIHDRLIEHLERTKISVQFDRSPVRIADEPHAKRRPVTLTPTIALAISVLLGLVAGLGTPLIIEIFDTRIRTPNAARQAASAQIIGEIPAFPPPRPGASASAVDPRVAEAFRALRSSLRLAHPPGGAGSVIAIVSTISGEGRSTVAAELAVGLAFSGLRILLVDADLRHPSQGARFEIKAELGLAHLLAGESGVVAQPCNVPNLLIVPAPVATTQAAELLHSHCLDEWLNQMRADYDFIVIDTPPLSLYADAHVLAASADLLALIIRHGVSSREAVAEALETLGPLRERLAGVVYNAAELRPDRMVGDAA